jgi:hypothetical protein
MLSSIGEIRIHTLLEDMDIPFIEEYTYPDLSSGGRPLRFDFAVFDPENDEKLLCLIEYQGEQHYKAIPRFGGYKGLKKQQYNDNLKRQYCLKNNIRLVAIPYYDENRINYDYMMQIIYGY